MCEVQKITYHGEYVYIRRETREQAAKRRYETIRNAILALNGEEVLSMLKDAHDIFEKSRCVQCSKCHELQERIEAFLENFKESDE